MRQPRQSRQPFGQDVVTRPAQRGRHESHTAGIEFKARIQQIPRSHTLVSHGRTHTARHGGIVLERQISGGAHSGGVAPRIGVNLSHGSLYF